jgi:hypothetical protein
MHRSSARQIDDFEDTAASGRPLLFGGLSRTSRRWCGPSPMKRSSARPRPAAFGERIESKVLNHGLEKLNPKWRGF